MKKVLVLSLALVALGGALWWWLIHHNYEEQTCRDLFAQAVNDADNLHLHAKAFRELGPAGAAFLADQLVSKPSRSQRWYESFRSNFRRWLELPPWPVSSAGGWERECAKRLLGHLETKAAPALCRRLKKLQPDDKNRVLQAMGELGPAAGDEVGRSLALSLDDASTAVLAQAIASLGMTLYRPEEIVPKLAPLLKHPEQSVRLEAAYTLGTYAAHPQGILAPLMEALDDSSPTVRANAARALGRLGSQALPAVAKLKTRLDDPVLPAARAAEALILIDRQAATNYAALLEQPLTAAERSSNDYFRLIALSSRLRLGEDPKDLVQTCLRQLRLGHAAYARWEAVERLIEAKATTPDAAEALRKAAEDSNGYVRRQAMKAGRLPMPAAP